MLPANVAFLHRKGPVLQCEAHEKEVGMHQSENWTAGICDIVPIRRKRPKLFLLSGVSALNEAWTGLR